VFVALIIGVTLEIKARINTEFITSLYQQSMYKVEDKVVFETNNEPGHIIGVYCSSTIPDCLYSVRLNVTLDLIKDVKNFELRQQKLTGKEAVISDYKFHLVDWPVAHMSCRDKITNKLNVKRNYDACRRC
jgi:hypothetical protein